MSMMREDILEMENEAAISAVLTRMSLKIDSIRSEVDIDNNYKDFKLLQARFEELFYD